MDSQSKSESSPSVALMGKGRRRRAKPSGLPTPPATPSVAPPETPQAAPKKNDWSREPPAERLDVANAALREALARYQSLGALLFTKNVDGEAVIRLRGMHFLKPGSNDPTLKFSANEVTALKPPASPTPG